LRTKDLNKGSLRTEDLNKGSLRTEDLNTKLKIKLNGLSPRASYTERPPPIGEVSANFCGEYNVASMTDPYGHILGFLGRSHYFFLQVAPQLYSRC
jgi:hypothetical protein